MVLERSVHSILVFTTSNCQVTLCTQLMLYKSASYIINEWHPCVLQPRLSSLDQDDQFICHQDKEHLICWGATDRLSWRHSDRGKTGRRDRRFQDTAKEMTSKHTRCSWICCCVFTLISLRLLYFYNQGTWQRHTSSDHRIETKKRNSTVI